jgi:hypothetical protein
LWAADVRIKADAVQNGQGGTVVVWADDSTRFHGSISARGGSQGGDGGQVETSGKEFLVAAGSVNASAARGQGGVWLLDPRDVTIANAATSGGAYAANVFTPTADNAVADRNTIQTALNGGTNVTINYRRHRHPGRQHHGGGLHHQDRRRRRYADLDRRRQHLCQQHGVQQQQCAERQPQCDRRHHLLRGGLAKPPTAAMSQSPEPAPRHWAISPPRGLWAPAT